LKYNDRLISYRYINEADYEIIGDFQQISFLNDDSIKVMPAYFREFGSKSQSLIVRVSVDKKYGFENLGKVVSKEFGELKTIGHEWIRHYDKIDDIIYSMSLEKMDVNYRKKRVLKDTITVSLGNKKFLFTPVQ